jgi:glutaredoxin
MFHLFVIEGCPYCKAAIDLVKKNKVQHQLTWVEHNKKDFYKKRHNMSTFPQVFYKSSKTSKTMSLIGGCSDFENLMNSLSIVKEYNLPNITVSKILSDMN